jgi:hypothetical protein
MSDRAQEIAEQILNDEPYQFSDAEKLLAGEYLKLKSQCIDAVKARAKSHADMTEEMEAAGMAADDSLLQAAYTEIILDIEGL